MSHLILGRRAWGEIIVTAPGVYYLVPVHPLPLSPGIIELAGIFGLGVNIPSGQVRRKCKLKQAVTGRRAQIDTHMLEANRDPEEVLREALRVLLRYVRETAELGH
jgi:hypothetical protein